MEYKIFPNSRLVDFAQDAAENLQMVCDAQKAPLTSGYVLVAFDNKGDTTMTAITGKMTHIVDALCNAIEKTDHGAQVFDALMDELEKRVTARKRENKEMTKKTL